MLPVHSNGEVIDRTRALVRVAPRQFVHRKLLQAAFAFVVILTLVGPITTGNQLNAGNGSPLRQILFIGTAMIAVVGLRPLSQPRLLLTVPWTLLIGLAYCAITLAWAIEPAIGARRLFLTALVIWIVFATVRHIGFARSLTILRIILGLAVFANIATALLLPSVGVHQAADVLDKNLIGDWCGFMVQKNHTAAATAITVLAFTFGGGRLSIGVRAFVLAGATFLLFKTGSRTSIGMCLASLVLGGLFLRYKTRYLPWLVGLVIIAMVAATNLNNAFRFNMASSASGRQTVSGRFDIWEAMLGYAKDNHFIGAGFGSFWDIGARSPIFHYGRPWVTTLGQGHNGYVDLLASVGVVGLVIIVVMVFVVSLVRLLTSRAAQGTRGAFVLTVIAFCAGHNGTETSLFDRDSIIQVMLMVALALLSRVLVEPVPPGERKRRVASWGVRDEMILTMRDGRIDDTPKRARAWHSLASNHVPQGLVA